MRVHVDLHEQQGQCDMHDALKNMQEFFLKITYRKGVTEEKRLKVSYMRKKTIIFVTATNFVK
jgi:hypothetical protein